MIVVEWRLGACQNTKVKYNYNFEPYIFPLKIDYGIYGVILYVRNNTSHYYSVFRTHYLEVCNFHSVQNCKFGIQGILCSKHKSEATNTIKTVERDYEPTHITC